MNEKEKGKKIAVALTALILLFYFTIVSYVLFYVVDITGCENFVLGLVFEIIGMALLGFIILGNAMKSKKISLGYYIPIVVVTVIYTLILNVVNMIGIFVISNMFFFLIHMLILFVYLMIVVPMYIMGRQ